MKRREFLNLGLGSVALASLNSRAALSATYQGQVRPIVISTWSHGLAANEAAWNILSPGGTALDAVEQGVRVSESDPNVTSVGLGGFPNRDGVVQLDAHIMDGRTGRAGAVCALEHIENPISVARKVLDLTPHVLLAGAGALEFALANGFRKTNLLTETALKAWQEWKKSQKAPALPPDSHDTIGMCALDRNGDLAVACTTSGLAWKIPGRVGDSPICGAGSYCDNSVGAACSTGMGEEVLQTGGSFLVVELMRQGRSPEEACAEACRRIIARTQREASFHRKDLSPHNVIYLALRKDGLYGACGVGKGGQMAAHSGENKLLDVRALLTT